MLTSGWGLTSYTKVSYGLIRAKHCRVIGNSQTEPENPNLLLLLNE